MPLAIRPRCASVKFGLAALDADAGPRSESRLSGRSEASSSATRRNDERIACADECVSGVLEWKIVGARGVRPGCAIFGKLLEMELEMEPGGERFCVYVRVRLSEAELCCGWRRWRFRRVEYGAKSFFEGVFSAHCYGELDYLICCKKICHHFSAERLASRSVLFQILNA